jgi:hypothetical protein
MHVKGEAGASPFFVSVVSNSSPKPVVPALCSFYFCQLLPAIHPIACGNHLHWSLQFAQLLVALAKKLVIFSKNIKDFLKFLFMFSKKLGGDLKALGSYSEKSARLSKNVVVAPSKAGGKWGTARKR